MPAAPLLALDQVDLTRTVIDRDEILALIKQRGRFALLDGIVHWSDDPARVVGFKDIRADDWWTTDHIPGRPIFPGALMVEAAAQLASFDYMRRNRCAPETFLGFGGLENVRFRGVVSPGVRFLLACEPRRVRSRMFTYAAQGFVGRDMVFEGDIIGVIV